MGDIMQGQMDDLIQSGIALRNAIDEELEKRGWKGTDKIEYEACVTLIGAALIGKFFND